MKIFKPIDAITLIGIPCTKRTARIYANNMGDSGIFKSSLKVNRHWMITEEDVIRVRKMILAGDYVPSARQFKKQAA